MPVVVRMPEVATGAAEAAIQSWLVAVGDDIAAGQAIVEIETEKAVVEYESEDAGTVAALLLDSGASASVGTPIAILAAAGESAAEAIAGAGVDAPEPADEPAAEPAAAPVETDIAPPARDRLFASPLVRRLARERDIDLAVVAGSGPNGRVVRRDLDAFTPQPSASETSAPSAPSVPTAVPAAMPSDVSVPTAAHTDVPHTRMRRAIARRLTESSSTVPHFFVTADCIVDELLALRARITESAGIKVSLNDFVLKAVAAAMREVPDANVIWTDDATRRFESVDLAVAVSIPGGLVTPVVRGVDRLTLGQISTTVRELADKAREGRLSQSDLEGGSFSVSNLGMFGTKEFTAIINPPHSGILAVGGAQRRPVVIDDALAIASVMTVTLSADHRVIDGALAAQWLAAFVRKIENPWGLLV